MAETEQTKPKKRIRWLLWGLGVAMLLTLLVAAGRYWYGIIRLESELQEAYAEADRLDPGWRLDELEQRRLTIANEENSALTVRTISQAMPRSIWPSNESYFLLPSSPHLPPPSSLNAAERQTMEADLHDVAAALAKVGRLADQPFSRYPNLRKPNHVSVDYSYLSEVRNAARLLEYRAVFQADNGEGDQALESCRAGLNVARSLGDEPSSVAVLVRQAATRIALLALERVLAQTAVSSEELARCQQLLEMEAAVPLLLIGLRGDRVVMDQLDEQLKQEGYPARSLEALGWDPPDIFADAPVQGTQLSLSSYDIRRTRVEYFRHLTRAVEVAKQPVEEQPARFHQLAQELATLSPLSIKQLKFVENSAKTYWRNTANLRTARAALAVERYRLAHQRWPESLADLVPNYLAGVPLDPYDGRPLRYRRIADGIIVYSVGPDGNDNGGKANRTRPNAAGHDFVFQLLDLDKRRQPAVDGKRPE